MFNFAMCCVLKGFKYINRILAHYFSGIVCSTLPQFVFCVYTCMTFMPSFRGFNSLAHIKGVFAGSVGSCLVLVKART